MLQAEVSHPSDDEALQIHAGESGGPPLERRENVESCPAGRVGHRGQVDERLDRPISKLLPYPLIFLLHLVVRRVRRPVYTYAPEVFEAHLDGTVDPIQCDIEFHAQASDGGTVDHVPGPARQQRQLFFRRQEIAGQKLALGPLELQREGERVPLLPTVLWQQRTACDKIPQRRGISCLFFGPLAAYEIQFGDPLSLLQRIDQLATAIELIDDLEDLPLDLLGRRPRQQQPADPEMCFPAQLFREQ